jgi:Tfp pilus assembly protein PilE
MVQQAGPGPVPGVASKTSGMAIAGFILAFVCSLLGLIFSIIGLSQINKSNGTLGGKGLAIAGIVISVIFGIGGMLAAVAIPAFLDYMHKSKASEAPLELNRIGKLAKLYYANNGSFPTGTSAVLPANPSGQKGCCGSPNNKCEVSSAWATDPVWKELEFSVDEPGNYRYSFTGNGKSFVATAVGDLDCDGEEATYTLQGQLDAAGNPSVNLTQPPHGVY